MRITSLLILLLSILQAAMAQEDPGALVREGVSLFDKGEYQKALKRYERALELRPRSSTILYEMALTRYSMKEYEPCIILADTIIAIKDNNLPMAYSIKASALLALGRMEESDEVLMDGLEATGGDAQLFYNLGVNFMKQERIRDAETCFLNTIRIKPTHASAYLMIAGINRSGNPVKALLSAYHFLLLEPNSARSGSCLDMVWEILEGKAKKDTLTGNSTIYMDEHTGKDSIYTSVALAINIGAAARDQSQEQDDFSYFKHQTQMAVELLGGMNKYDGDDLWAGYLIPLFADIYASNYGDVFTSYIARSRWPAAAQWLESHGKELEAFGKFLKGE